MTPVERPTLALEVCSAPLLSPRPGLEVDFVATRREVEPEAEDAADSGFSFALSSFSFLAFARRSAFSFSFSSMAFCICVQL